MNTIGTLREVCLGLNWIQIGDDRFEGSLQLKSKSYLRAFVTQIEVDAELCWGWSLQLDVWDETVRTHLVPSVLVMSGLDGGDTTATQMVSTVAWAVSKLSASVISMLEADAHQFDYVSAYLAMQGSRMSDLKAEFDIAVPRN